MKKKSTEAAIVKKTPESSKKLSKMDVKPKEKSAKKKVKRKLKEISKSDEIIDNKQTDECKVTGSKPDKGPDPEAKKARLKSQN